MNKTKWTKLFMHELGSFYSITQAHRQFSVMVSKPDSCASELGSIPGRDNFLENFILLNSSKIRQEFWKKLECQNINR